MNSILGLRATTQKRILHWLSLWVIASLLVAAAFTAQPISKAMAASCTSVLAGGAWGDTATWSCGAVPGAADDVTISSPVTIGGNQAVHNVSIVADGVLQFTAVANLTVNGNFNVDALGIFDPGNTLDGTGGTVIFGAGSQVITTNGEWVDFYNLTKLSTATDTLSVDPAVAGVGGIHILNNLVLKGDATHNLSLRSTDAVTHNPWQIDPVGGRNVDYLDVQDSTNVNETLIAPLHSVNSGNNVGWTLATATTVMDLVSSLTPSTYNQSVIFTATLTPSSATGTVDFTDGGEDVCSLVTVTGGIAECTISTLTPGSHTILATYSGDGSNSPATKTVVQEVKVQSNVLLTTDSDIIAENTPVTFRSLVHPPLTTTGSVTFKDGGSDIAGCVNVGLTPLTGIANCSTSALTKATHIITAVYNGDANNFPATSNVVNQIVKGLSTVGLASTTASVYGQSVALTATAGPSGVTGKVTFRADGVDIPSCSLLDLTGLTATCNTSTLAVGARAITAVYTGNADYADSTSAVATQTVNKADTTSAISGGLSGTKFVGVPMMVTATIAPVAPGAGVPGGTVTIGNGVVSCTATLSGGVGSCALTFTSGGTKALTASYTNLDGNYNNSTSTATDVTVNGRLFMPFVHK